MPASSDAPKPRYDAIVIGGGIGGLTAANRLGRFGRSVLLLEQHHELGGLAAYFRRDGHVFDTALHGFPWGMVKTCRKYWTQEMADCIVPLTDIRFDNPQFQLRTTFTTEDFTDKLIHHFGVEPDAVHRFFKTCRAMNFYDDIQQSTEQLFETFFPGRTDVMRFLMEPITYANGSTLSEPAPTYGIVFSNFMNQGVYFFQGGTDKFIALARKALAANGVDICTGSAVQCVRAEGGRVTGVQVNGKTIDATAVIANTNLNTAILDLIGAEALPPDFVRRAEAVPLSTSICQVYMGLREDTCLPEVGDIIFHSTAPAFAPAGYLCHPPQSRSFSLYYPKSRPGHNRSSVVASMGACYDDWCGLDPAAYAAAKEALIETALGAFEAYVPDIRSRIDTAEAATPVTFARYTRHPRGATFGTKFPGLSVSEDLPSVLPGMYHTGSVGIIMSGWLGAANYGVLVANKADEYLDTQL